MDNAVPFLWTDPAAPPGVVPDQLIVFFREQAMKDEESSKVAGYDIFDNVLMAEISAGGHGAKSTVVHECERKKPDGTVIKHPVYYRRYQTIIEQFKSGQTDNGVGTPLNLLPGMDAAKMATLKASGVHFVETLATVPDSMQITQMMGFGELRGNARKFIDLREKNAPMVKMEAVEKELRAENERLQRQMDELVARFGGTEQPKRGPGRPRKEEQEAA
jgi:hypothetical protein